MNDVITLGKDLAFNIQYTCAYTTDAGVWYYYEHGRWRPDPNEFEITRECEYLISRRIREAVEGQQDYRDAKSAANRVETVVKRARTGLGDCELLMSAFDADGNALNTPDGYYNVKDGDRDDNSPTHYTTRMTRVAPAKSWAGGKWEEFLDVVLPDVEDQLALQGMMGYVLLGEQLDKAVFFLQGDTNRGKSLLLNAIENSLGDYAITTKTDLWLSNNKTDYAMADLVGKRLITCAEFDEHMRVNTSLIKTFTGGEHLEARMIYGKPFRFKPQGTIVISTNKMPYLGSDDAAWGRIYMLPFNGPEVGSHQFSWEGDGSRNLRQTLLSNEVAGEILRWMLDGVWYYQNHGITVPETSIEAVAQERADQRHHSEIWIEEYVSEGKPTPMKDIYSTYRLWALFTEGMTESKLLSSTALGKRLRNAGFEPYRNENTRGWLVNIAT